MKAMRGADLLREKPSEWAEWQGSGMLLNPRMDERWREKVLRADFPDLPDHVWLATSGTGGKLKVVALSRRALEASANAVNHHLGATKEDVWLNPLPLFHAGGLGIVVRAAMNGAERFELGAWDPAGYGRKARETDATLSSLVPAQVYDLVKARVEAPESLRAIVVGGGILDEGLRKMAVELGWRLLPSYGLTETGSQVATARSGQADFSMLPLLEHATARVDAEGVLMLRGASLLTGCLVFDAEKGGEWIDPKVDGELHTGDRAEVIGRNVRVLGRVDDLVKIRGELVDIVALERSLESRVGLGRVVLEGSDDRRNGFNIRVVTCDDETANAVREAMDIFPPYARPHEIIVGEIRRTALGKVIRKER